MHLNHKKHIFLSYVQPKRIVTTLIVLTFVLVVLYFYIGRMNFLLCVLSAGVVIGFVQALRQTFDRGPLRILGTFTQLVDGQSLYTG